VKTPVPPYTFNNTWAIVILRAFDVFWGCVVWRDYDITISSWTGLELRKPKAQGWARDLGWVLNHISPGHCEGAIKADIVRAQAALTILGAD
jgi:hypothetical protein